MTNDVLLLAGAIVVAIALVLVVRARHRSHGAEQQRLAGEMVCNHLRPVMELLVAGGHRVRRIGQRHPDLPLEIHIVPEFSPQDVYDELKLSEPVLISERGVLYCKEDWCEIHPAS